VDFVTVAVDARSSADCRPRALALWPGIDRARLRRTRGEPRRVARLIEQRTRLPFEVIVAMLTGEPIAQDVAPD
jgi:hypothetical protein